MTDIDDLLIKITKRCNLVHNYPADRELLKECADEIESHRLELEMMRATILVPSQKDDRRTIERLREELVSALDDAALLREAIRPLVAVLVNYPDVDYDNHEYVEGISLSVSFRDLLAARKALGETNENP